MTQRSARELRSELLPIIAGHVLLHAAMAGARMAAPLFALAGGHGKAAAGLLVALFALTQVFLSLPAGRFADRHGLKRPVGLAVVATCMGGVLAAAWPSYGMLCLTALVCGGAIGAATIALQRHVGRMAQSPTELKQAFSWFSIGPAASNFLGPFAAGVAIDQGGYRVAFALLAAMPVAAWVLLRRARELPGEVDTSQTPRTETRSLLRDAGLRRLLVMNWFMNASWDLHGFMVPLLAHERGLSASTTGSILGAFAIAAACIRFVMPLVAGRIREWALITGATAAAGIVFLVYPLSPAAWVMALCSALLGMALGVVQPLVMSLLHQITPRHRHGEAVATRLMLVNISSVAMPVLFGLMGGFVGAAGVFWVMGTVVSLGSRLGTGLRGLSDDND